MGGKRNERETREKGERGLRAHSTAHTARNTAREREREMGYGGSHPVKCVLCGVVCSNVATTTRLANTDSRYSISLISRQIKYSGPGGGHRRKMVDDHEENLTISGAKLERARLKYVEKDEDAKAEKERVCVCLRERERERGEHNLWVCCVGAECAQKKPGLTPGRPLSLLLLPVLRLPRLVSSFLSPGTSASQRS